MLPGYSFMHLFMLQGLPALSAHLDTTCIVVPASMPRAVATPAYANSTSAPPQGAPHQRRRARVP